MQFWVQMTCSFINMTVVSYSNKFPFGGEVQ